MLKRLACIEGGQELHIKVIADAYLKNSSKKKKAASQPASASNKRKAPDDITHHQSLVPVDPVLAITILSSILDVNASALTLLSKVKDSAQGDGHMRKARRSDCGAERDIG
jgi:hypothetical protein